MRLLIFLLVLLFCGSIQAQSYPARSVRMLLAFPPGGPTDINARLFAQKLTEQTGQAFVVENRPGAGGNIAAAEAAKAAPDGTTIFYNTSAINPGVPAKNLQEFVAYAKANPGKLNYASSGSGTITHLSGALFASQLGLKMQHIPYKGSAPALLDVVGGQTQMMIDTISTVLPEVPTLEGAANLPGFEMSAWQGIVVPAALI